MVSLDKSRDPEKLKKVIAAARTVFSRYPSISKEDKEEMLMDVIYKFEVAEKDFALSCYTKLAKDEIWGYFTRKFAKKRTQQWRVEGKTEYLETISLNVEVYGSDDHALELGDLVPTIDNDIPMVEFLADVERYYPKLYILLQRAMNGEELTKNELRRIKKLLKSGV